MRSHRQRARHASEFDSLMGSSDMGDTSSSIDIDESSRDADETSSISGSIHSGGSSSVGTRQTSSVSSSYMGRYSSKRNVLNYTYK
ncbi:unnamed protein product [Ambrosiozyma monospora]|nr:unnamed protein product [Ambrosiozyma monospora]